MDVHRTSSRYIVTYKIKTKSIIRDLLLAVLHLILDYFLSFTMLHLVFNLTVYPKMKNLKQLFIKNALKMIALSLSFRELYQETIKAVR